MKCLILFSFTMVCGKMRCVRNPGACKLNARKFYELGYANTFLERHKLTRKSWQDGKLD